MIGIQQALCWLELSSKKAPSSADSLSFYDQVAHLYKGGKAAPAANMALGLLSCGVLYPHAPELAVSWLSLIVAINAIRFLHLRSVNMREESTDTLFAARYFTAGSSASGMCWGLLPILFFPVIPLDAQIFIAFVIAGVTSGGITILSSVRAAALLFLIPSVIPLICGFLLGDSSLHYTMAVMCILYLGFMIRVTLQTHQTLSNSFLLIRNNQKLLIEVQEQSSKIVRMNNDLTQALKEANQVSEAKSQFLAHMSHEIRTPIGGIIGMLELATQDCNQPVLKEQIEIAHNSAESLLGIINDILDISKIEAGKLIIEKTHFSLRSMLEQTVNTIEASYKDNAIIFVTHIEDNVPAHIVSDEVRIRQILTNLLGNAAKFTPKNGAVVLGVYFQENKGGTGKLELSISDTGIGIPDSKTADIFKAFTQADSSTTRVYGGTGLGLSITSELVRLLGGDISLKSEVKRGTCFSVELPVQIAATHQSKREKPGEVKPIVEKDGRTIQVLVAEDNKVNQRLFKSILTKAGYDVHFVENGKEAVDASEKSSFDLILMDCQMPVMSGYDAAKQIRERENKLAAQTDRIPIIAVTAHAMSDEKQKCLDAGMDGYVTKPIRKAELFTAMAKAIQESE